ncbi:MAG: hypothetical protein P8K78_04220 [Pirellulales bacterium]|nr:hypothetical protein [Pirellulales bacterium]
MNRSESVSIRQSPLQFLAAGAVATNRAVGLADLSLLEKWGVKGPGAASWLAERGVEIPQTIYASRPLSEGGLVVRVGSDEFFLEAGQLDQSLASLGDSVPAAADFTPVIREDAALLITGCGGLDLFAQTCGHPLQQSPMDQIIFTRVAGVSCGILPQSSGEEPQYRVWFDPSYAVYLGETLLQIASELGEAASEPSV